MKPQWLRQHAAWPRPIGSAPKQLAHKLQNNERQVQCIFWFEFYIHRPADYYCYIMGQVKRCCCCWNDARMPMLG